MTPWPVVARYCEGEDEGSVVETAHAGFDLHVLQLQVVVQGTEQVDVEVFEVCDQIIHSDVLGHRSFNSGYLTNTRNDRKCNSA